MDRLLPIVNEDFVRTYAAYVRGEETLSFSRGTG